MATLLKLREDISFNKNLNNLLDVMRSVAAQQYQVLERAFRANARLFDVIGDVAALLDVEHFQHPFTQAEGKVGVIAVTSDAGLLGGLNNQVVLTAVEEYKRNPGELIIIGRRGSIYAREYGVSSREFPGIQDTGRRRLAGDVRDYAFQQLTRYKLGALSIVYPRALSFSTQRVEIIQAIPCQGWMQGENQRIRTRGGKIMLESPRGKILEYLVWLWLGEKLYEIFGTARLAELGARAVHLEGSTQELRRKDKKLRMQFLRKRREMIDASMRELFAARSLYRKTE